jgi:hypothetical protein
LTDGFGTRANGGYQALEGGEDQGDAAITGVSPTNPAESQANQEEGVEMPFGARQLLGGNQSAGEQTGLRSVALIERLSLSPPKTRETAGSLAPGES